MLSTTDGALFLHHRVATGGLYGATVNGKAASAEGSTLGELVRGWLASADASQADLQVVLVDHRSAGKAAAGASPKV